MNQERNPPAPPTADLIACILYEVDLYIARHSHDPDIIILSRELYNKVLMDHRMNMGETITRMFNIPLHVGNIDGFVIGKFTPYKLREEDTNGPTGRME